MKKELSDKRVIEVLKQAEIDFRKAPNINIKNTDGLCYYLKDVFGLDWFDVEYILEKKYSGKEYTFCKGMNQHDVYKREDKRLYFERADWCRDRIKDFQVIK